MVQRSEGTTLGGAMQTKIVALALAVAAPFAVQAQSWEPTKNVEFIIPAGTGGGADQMARAIQGIVAKHNLAKVAILPINKSGGAGAEGFLDVKNSAGDPHKIIITLSNLFTTPLATGVPFNWREAGRPDHHRRDRAAHRGEVHLHPVQGRRRGGDAARRRPRRLDGEQPDRSRGAVARRQSASAMRVRAK